MHLEQIVNITESIVMEKTASKNAQPAEIARRKVGRVNYTLQIETWT